jgi:putative hydrolase of the HAD superfamily
MDVRALLFDVNGTLIDIETDEALEEIYRAIGHYLTYQGVSLHRWEVHDLYFQVMKEQRETSLEAHPEWNAVAVWREVLRRTAREYTRSLPPEKLHQIPVFLTELHRGIARKRLRLYPQVRAVLDQLRPQYRMAAVTDAQSAYAVPELKAVGLLEYFDPVIVSGDYGYRKPDTRLFQQALEQLQVRPEQALFVGNDMYRDVFGAQQVGMKAIFFSSNQGDKAHPGVQPDYVIHHFSELTRAVDFFVAH